MGNNTVSVVETNVLQNVYFDKNKFYFKQKLDDSRSFYTIDVDNTEFGDLSCT